MAGLTLIVSVIVLVGTHTFLPLQMVARNVREGMGLRERPEVGLQGDPPPAILAGMFSGSRISLGDADPGDVRVRRVVVNLDPSDRDVTESVIAGVRSRSPARCERRSHAGAGAQL